MQEAMWVGIRFLPCRVGAMADLLALLSRDTQLKRVANTGGGEWSGPCPFCGGTDRFRVWPNAPRPRYWCRVCGRHGDAIQYLRDRYGLSFREACERVGARPPEAGSLTSALRLSPGPPSGAWQDTARALLSECVGVLNGPRGQAAREYLHSRGLDDKTIWRARLGLNLEERWVGKTRLDRGILIPWFLEGDIWAINVRRWDGVPLGDPKYRALAGSVKALYGAAHLQGVHLAFVCEGEFDALLLQQEIEGKVAAGAVAVGGTAGLHDAAVLYLLGCTRILVCGDNDRAGEAFAARWRSLSTRVRVVRVPAGYHDLTDFYQRGGRLRDWAEYQVARLQALEGTGEPW